MEKFEWEFELLNDPELEALLGEVIEYTKVVEKGRWLTLLGQPGCGKTHLAKKLVSYWNKYHIRYDGGKQVKYGKFRPWAQLYAQAWDNKGILMSMKDVGLLVIDDIGAQHQSDYDASLINALMDIRAGMPTVITSNKTYDELRTEDPRNFSRMKRNGVVCQTLATDFSDREGVGHLRQQAELPEITRIDEFRADDIADPDLKDIAERLTAKFNTI